METNGDVRRPQTQIEGRYRETMSSEIDMFSTEQTDKSVDYF